METEATRSEEEATTAYESFVKETDASIAAATEEKAKAEKDKVQAEDDMAATMYELEQLSMSKAELHQSCDFVVKNFEIRQQARDEEVEALKQAKAILSGADFSMFLQA